MLDSVPEGITVIGVDEDTALVRFRTHWQVLGLQGVSVFDRERREKRYGPVSMCRSDDVVQWPTTMSS